MATEESNTEPEVKVIPKKSLIGRIFKFLLIFVLCLFILVIGVLIFIQTDTFDKIALNYALDKINASLSEKESTVYAESLTGNLFKGFTLNNGSIKVKEDTLLKFNSIQAKYNIWSLLNKEISVQDLILKEPQINITNVRDKNDSVKWNLTYLLEKSEPDEDTTTSEFDWGITAENLVIENGSIRILENKNSTLPIREIVMPKLDTFEIGKLDMNRLNLNLSAKYFPGSKEADIKNLSFETNSDFNVNKLALQAFTDKEDKFVSLKNFSLITDRTDFRINELMMNGLEPFDAEDYEEFDDNIIKLDLNTTQFNFKDLSFFLPDLNFLDSTVALELAADGPYGNLNIEKLNLRMPNSTLSFEGNVKNLNNPSEIYFDIKGKDIEIEPRDTKRNLPGLDIPDYSYLGGNVRIPYLTYVGEPEKFNTDFDIRTPAGNAEGNAFFDLTQDVIRYKGDFSTTNFNIGKIVRDKELESSITGDFKVDASGFDYQTASGKLDYELKRTIFLGQNISSSTGKLDFNKGNIGLNVSYNSEAVQTKLEGKINISNLKNITYDLKGTATGLNISAFTKDQSQKSNLNFSFDINGSGFDPDFMTGKYNINLNQSTFGDFIIPVTPVLAEIDQSGNIRKISVKTNFVNADFDGSIKFSSLSEVINNNIEMISAGFSNGLLSDSARLDSGLNNIPVSAYSYSSICNDLNFKYALDVKDLSPFISPETEDTLVFKGSLSGNFSDSCGRLNFTSNGIIAELRFKDSIIIADSALVDISIRNDLNNNTLSSLDAHAIIKANKLIVSKQTLDTTSASFNFSKNRNTFVIVTERDSTAHLYTEGSLQDSLTFRFDTLALRYRNFTVTNNKDLVVKYKSVDSSQSIDFKQFTINSFNQRLNIAGEYSLTDSSDVKLSASNLDLSTYLQFIEQNPDTNDRLKGVIRYLDLEYKGVPKNPHLEFSAVSELLSIGNTQIGRLDANLVYSDYDLVSNISFYNRQNTGKFSLEGNLPIILNFSDEEIDSVQRLALLADKTVNLNAIANNFQLRVFQQLLPYTKDLSGILEGKISLLGTAEKPVLTGKMDVNSGKLYVTINKMNYDFFANLSTDNEKLVINNARLFIPSEESRFISAAGFIDFSGLTFKELYIEMTGDVKAYDKDNGQTELGISGDLWVGSGRNRLTLSGNPNRFDLKGNLILVKGNIVFNPFSQEAYNLYSDDFDYGIIIDSTKKDGQTINKVLRQSRDSVVVFERDNLNPFQKILYLNDNRSLVRKEARSEGGKFFYDIIVTTSGNVFLKFIVNEKSQQEFFGEIITQDLNVFNYEDYTMMGRGTVRLGDNCYYKFFRKFDATGSTTFFGPISNPRLNINAQYKGYASTGTDASGRDQLEDVIIDLKVTGEAASPVLTMSLTTGGVKSSGSDATSDAISFLLFGKFANQLSFSESSSFGASLGASYLSNYVSSSIEDIFPWLINTSFSYIGNQDGSVAQNTDVRFTAAIGDAVVRFGGQIFKGLANTDIIVDYPINKLLKLNSLSNNLIFRFERVYDPFYNDADITNTDGTRVGGLVYYLIKF